jgi:hypothetical protein
MGTGGRLHVAGESFELRPLLGLYANPRCSENPAYCATPFLGSSPHAGTVRNENTFWPARGPAATRELAAE